MNWGHLGSAVKCSHSSLTVRTVFAIVFVGILRSVKCWAGVRRKTPGSFLRAAADAQSLGLLNTAAAKPRGPLLRLLEPTDQTLKRRTVKTHLVRERRARWVAVIVSWWKRKTKNDFALTFWTNVFSQQLLVTYLHLSMFRNASYLLTIPLLKNVESFRRLVTKQLILYLRVPPAVGKASSVYVFSKSKSKNKNMETKQESSI